ncbi:MAG: gamma-glutamyl-gamma-aminobutyrate hydrolase family protein [Methanomicrobiaceae archaeon]|nr:gamma-glutamyl-gamma-aminobutyrate hydrolase family protein [Methanomicrobiaceae archaeon]
MILIIDLCWKEDSLSHPEFVDPIVNIVKSAGEDFRIVHHLLPDLEKQDDFNAIILCGTALKDNGFRENERLIELIKNTGVPVLGVCAGMQVVALAYGGELTESLEIGMKNIVPVKNDEIFNATEIFEAYKLHGMRIQPNGNFTLLAESVTGPEVVKHISKQVWGVLFHPEVRNEWVIGNFVRYCCR